MTSYRPSKRYDVTYSVAILMLGHETVVTLGSLFKSASLHSPAFTTDYLILFLVVLWSLFETLAAV